MIAESIVNLHRSKVIAPRIIFAIILIIIVINYQLYEYTTAKYKFSRQNYSETKHQKNQEF